MKRTFLIIFTMLSVFAFSQNDDKAFLGDSTAGQTVEKQDATKSETLTVNEFLERYKISDKEHKRARVVLSAYLRKELDNNSEVISSIPVGTIVQVLKLFPKEQMWAVKYKNSFGFVAMSSLMQIRDNLPSHKLAFDVPPKLLNSIELEYPEAAVNKKIEGRVVLKLHVNKKGRVDKAEVIKGIPELNSAAISMTKKLRFRPAKLDRKKVDAWITFPVRFNINAYYESRRKAGY